MFPSDERSSPAPALDADEDDSIQIRLRAPNEDVLANETGRYLLAVPMNAAVVDLRLGDTMRQSRIETGAACFVEPGVFFQIKQREPLELLLVSFAARAFEAVAHRAAQGRAWHTTSTTGIADPAIAALATELRRALLGDSLPEPLYLRLLAQSMAVRLVCRFARESEHPRRGQAMSPAALRRVVQHIEANLPETLHVADLAAVAGVSASHFARGFHHMTGDPPMRFVLKRRLCRARDLLSDGQSEIAAIALMTGFSSQAHLSTVFRNELGTTPGRYRDAFLDGHRKDSATGRGRSAGDAGG